MTRESISILAWLDNVDGSFTVSLPALFKWAAAFVVAEWLRLPNVMRTLVIFMAIDYVTGVIAAIYRGEASSAAGFRGLIKKGMILVVLLTAHLIERATGIDVQIDSVLAIGYTVNESISIIENLAKTGVPIPAALVQAMMSVQKLRMQEATPEQLQELETGAVRPTVVD